MSNGGGSHPLLLSSAWAVFCFVIVIVDVPQRATGGRATGVRYGARHALLVPPRALPIHFRVAGIVFDVPVALVQQQVVAPL